MITDDRHPSADELADLVLGELDDAEAAAIKAHLAGCAPCMQFVTQLGGLSELLANIWYPPIPESLSLRVDNAITDAVQQRAVAAMSRSAWGRQGILDSPGGLGPFDHLCWVFRSKADWADRAVEYLADGIVAGQRIQIYGDASTAGLRAEVAELLSSLPASRAAGARPAEVLDVAGHFEYADGGIVDPDATMATRQTLVDDALAAGYTGLRTVADATSAVRTEAQREAVARLEYLGDRSMKSRPVSCMCSYNLAAIGPYAAAELACMHPFISLGAAPFRLYAERDADFGLAGTIDDATAGALFRKALERTEPPAGNELIVDARRAELIGDRALAELNAHAARIGRTAVLRFTASQSPSPAALSALTSLRTDTGDSSLTGPTGPKQDDRS